MRIREGLKAAGSGATAMIDVSDGFLRDLSRLCHASGVGAEIDTGLLPVASAPDYEAALRAALYGGDDYELCFTLPGSEEARLLDAWPEELAPVARVGTVTDGEGVITESGAVEIGGWDHLESTERDG